MTRLIMLVTSDGHWVVEDSPDFFEALGDPAPDYDGSLFAVKNLGFIRFQVIDGAFVEVELHPRNVELPALLAVQQQLHTSRCKLFRIKHFDTEWASEITSSAEHAIARLSELCAPAFSPPVNTKYVVEPQDCSVLVAQDDSPLRTVLQKWRMSFGHFDSGFIPFAIKHRVLSRMMIAGIKRGAEDPVFRFIGDGFQWLQQDYQFFGIGEKMVNLPDKNYGEWISEYYRSVARSGQPRYDIVTARIDTAPGQEEFFESRYERLLLPWKTPTPEIFVTLLSRTLSASSGARPAELASGRPAARKSTKSS